MFFFFNDTATTEIYTEQIVGSVRCVQETEFTELKASGKLPFRQVPVLEKDGKFFSQSIPLLRWICQTNNLYPTDPEQIYHAEIAKEVVNDITLGLMKVWFSKPEQKEEVIKKLLDEQFPPLLKGLENYFTQNCGENAWDKKSVSFADILLVDLFSNYFLHPSKVASYGRVLDTYAPNFRKYIDNLMNGAFKDYLVNRPKFTH
eukprot:TRINITY_DN2052_c0_g1_i2.p1 TRINITY_DN2052_c0_g1~~TRINITY_DN2052_c0_g1_i2.p1  ORF type:complete len:203 (-),score=70.86 TRINITY_DN2052_c0_g1_i2:130-738(-)